MYGLWSKSDGRGAHQMHSLHLNIKLCYYNVEVIYISSIDLSFIWFDLVLPMDSSVVRLASKSVHIASKSMRIKQVWILKRMGRKRSPSDALFSILNIKLCYYNVDVIYIFPINLSFIWFDLLWLMGSSVARFASIFMRIIHVWILKRIGRQRSPSDALFTRCHLYFPSKSLFHLIWFSTSDELLCLSISFKIRANCFNIRVNQTRILKRIRE